MPSPRVSPKSLLTVIDVGLDEIFRHADVYFGIAGAVGSLWLSLESRRDLDEVAVVAASIVGIVVGAVLAGLAIVSAFMDQAFLRKLKVIGRQPTRYMAPFIVTILLGLWAVLFILVLIALPERAPQWLVSTCAFFAGGATLYALASVVPGLKMLVDFIGLQSDAAEIPDDFKTN